MTIRVAHWGTGVTGREALRGILEHPDLDLVSLYVTQAAKIGKDAGELCGLAQTTGVEAHNSIDTLIAARPDCLVYAGTTAGREAEAAAEMARFLAAGIDVVTFALIAMVYPRAAPAEIRHTLEEGCAQGGSTFYATGSSPGFATLELVTAALSAAGRVDAVRIQEFVNVSRYGVPEAMKKSVGMGQPADYVPLRVQSGIAERWWGPLAHHAAHLLGGELDTLKFDWQTALTDVDIATDFGLVPKNTIAGFAWSLTGSIEGGTSVVVEQFMRAAPQVAPHWPQLPAGATHTVVRIRVEGRPTFHIDFPIDYLEAEKIDSSLIFTAMHTVNAIPAVHAAAAGVYGPDDLPAFASKNVRRNT
jgi:hypothetical protein